MECAAKQALCLLQNHLLWWLRMQDHVGCTEHPVSKLRGGGDVLGKLQKHEPEAWGLGGWRGL